tara:strand:+ start:923 stop:1606 length:684 start_codon:yes stop_codon:yes gene_type:complete
MINLEEINNNLDSKGYHFFDDIRDSVNVDEIAELIRNEMNEKSFKENSEGHQKLLKRIPYYSKLKDFLYEKAKRDFNFKGINSEYLVSRKVNPGNVKEKYRAHFDSHLFTLVVPLKIPDSGTSCGELIYVPNLRKNPSSELSNLLTKVYYKRYASKEGIENLAKIKKVHENNFKDYKPILFRGNTFLHTNKGVSNDASSYRLTCLSHFYDPYENYGIGKVLRMFRKR